MTVLQTIALDLPVLAVAVYLFRRWQWWRREAGRLRRIVGFVIKDVKKAETGHDAALARIDAALAFAERAAAVGFDPETEGRPVDPDVTSAFCYLPEPILDELRRLLSEDERAGQ